MTTHVSHYLYLTRPFCATFVRFTEFVGEVPLSSLARCPDIRQIFFGGNVDLGGILPPSFADAFGAFCPDLSMVDLSDTAVERVEEFKDELLAYLPLCTVVISKTTWPKKTDPTVTTAMMTAIIADKTDEDRKRDKAAVDLNNYVGEKMLPIPDARFLKPYEDSLGTFKGDGNEYFESLFLPPWAKTRPRDPDRASNPKIEAQAPETRATSALFDSRASR